MRTDGSLIKAPGVVCRPVQSISWRSMNSNRRDRRGTDRLQFNTLRDKRTGDENRPLFDFLLTFGSLVSPWDRQATVPANMLAAMKIVTLEDISVFTN